MMASVTRVAVYASFVAGASAFAHRPSRSLIHQAGLDKDAEKGPWESIEQQGDVDQHNICNGGKQLPDFYVIGQQKCGTSSIAEDLMDAGVKNVHGPQNDKEFHFFDAVSRLDYSLVGEEGIAANRAAWNEWMPDCPVGSDGEGSTPIRTVLADFTPSYQSVIPRPEGFAGQGPWLNAIDANLNAPAKMRELYGADASPKLQFAMMIREPLSQMQSAWYHAASFDFQNVCSSCRADSFRERLSSEIEGLRQSPKQFTQWTWNVMYARHLEEWLAHFEPSQFYVVPTNVYSNGNNADICHDLQQRLHFQMECTSKSGEEAEVTHAWSHEHPSLEEDTMDLRGEFESVFLQGENDRLVKLLANANKDGMGLANYAGEKGDEAGVRAWLQAGW